MEKDKIKEISSSYNIQKKKEKTQSTVRNKGGGGGGRERRAGREWGRERERR